MSGLSIAKQFSYELSKQTLTIVSGLAVGIDTSAHIGAIDANGKTIAVLGSGLDNIYPKENLQLYNEIIEKNGLIISEYEPKTPASAQNFLNRNRLVSAVSIGILVIEAAFRSGTSVTCKYAKEQNKKIFCIPHELDNKHGVGTNNLIKKGAFLVTSARDIIESYDFLSYISSKKIKKSKPNSSSISRNYIYEQAQYSNETKKINPDYLDLYNILNGPPLNITQICNKLNKSPSFVSNALFLLELDGIICKTPYGYQINIPNKLD